MAHIEVDKTIAGIRSLFMFRPETGKPLTDLAQVLLRGSSPLSTAERELIAAYVSHLNECSFCMNSHASAARCLYGNEEALVDDVLTDIQQSGVSEKMKALLNIAALVQVSGKSVTPSDIDAARKAGAGDMDIHDTVLIAAAFSMFNRYVDGLAAFTPKNREDYLAMGKRMAESGYIF
ncbi:MAG TPA: peroxidase-related enzyme [Flavitalea sp.]|nr:peroxidase-related enzyme [Flavitalea sp.]